LQISFFCININTSVCHFICTEIVALASASLRRAQRGIFKSGVSKLAQSEFSFINRNLPRVFKLREFEDYGFEIMVSVRR